MTNTNATHASFTSDQESEAPIGGNGIMRKLILGLLNSVDEGPGKLRTDSIASQVEDLSRH